ncbi:transposase [Sphingomonas sp. CFBP 8760]|nr:transposase [Sphingomonas sp. CFBP 8760]
MVAITTKRRFTDEFEREAVALWETRGRMQAEVAAELGIMPTMVRRWQRELGDGSAVPASPAAKPPVSPLASPADQASEIARLRRELDRARWLPPVSCRETSAQACREKCHSRRQTNSCRPR